MVMLVSITSLKKCIQGSKIEYLKVLEAMRRRFESHEAV